MVRNNAVSSNVPWTDEELRRSVEVYVILLRLQLQGADDRSEPLALALLSDALVLRNDAAIRYRMRNISSVAKELGAPTLNDFSPAERVGRLVRPKIREMLLGDAAFARLLEPNCGEVDDATTNARAALRILRGHIEGLASELAWRMHNGPPNHDDRNSEIELLRDALDDIVAIEKELERPTPDKEIVRTRSAKLLSLVATFGKWLGTRTTKFVDAALLAAAPLAAAKVTGLLPALVGALEAVSKAIAH
jgi:hypothetical protein